MAYKFKLKLILSIFFIIFILNVSLFSEDDTFLSDSNSFIFDSFMRDTLPGGYFYPTFIENYAPELTSLIEESNGFAMIDNPRVYFEGDSYINFSWMFNGFNINSVLNQGSPSVILPFSAINRFKIEGESPISKNYGFNFLSKNPEKSYSKITASAIYSDMGSYLPWADFMITNPATNRDELLYNERRKNLNNYFIDYILNRKYKNSNFVLSFNYFNVKRQFNDFNIFDNTYNEDGELFLFNSGYKKDIKKGFYEIFCVFNYSKRSNLNAETGSYPQETQNREGYSYLTGFNLKRGNLDFKISFQGEREKIKPFEDNFSKNLMDNDGDGFFPFTKLGTFNGKVLNVNLNFQMNINKNINIDPFFDFKYSMLNGIEEINDYNAICFDNDPYLVVLWNRGDEYNNTNANLRTGVRISAHVSKDISFVSKIFLQYSNLSFDYSENNMNLTNLGYDIGFILFKNRKTQILLSYGVIPYHIRENVNFFLEQKGSYGTIYRWNDPNKDLYYQKGEQGEIYGYTGAAYHFKDENISAPVKKRLLLSISTKFSKKWTFNVKAIYKKIENNFWVEFDKEYGFYERINGDNFYFYRDPFKDYHLTNYDYKEDPFYAQLLLNLKGGVKNRWFFNFSFLAHIGMGETAFGNGAGSNDIGIINESQANPNSHINGYGRVDGDRAFVAKCYAGFYISRKLSIGISLKYRDGDPFAFINYKEKYNQYILYYETIKAEDKKGQKGGPREDYLADISLRLNYFFKLFNKDAVLSFSIFNILDVGYELSEYVFSGGDRDAMELHIPSSIRLSFSIKL